LPVRKEATGSLVELKVFRRGLQMGRRTRIGFWLSPEAFSEALKARFRQVWWWLPPVIFPDDEKSILALLKQALGLGARTFVLNDPWQVSLFEPIPPPVQLWAGPFCNLANPLALETAATLGFSGAIVSPELAAEDFLELPRSSPLPLGVVVYGNWPLCIGRAAAANLHSDAPFRSPKKEEAWATRYGSLYWVFPNWRLDLRNQMQDLKRAGYVLFVSMIEPVPKMVRLKDRPGVWNWKGELL
jgi:putative protease